MCGAGRQDKSSGVIRARKQHKLVSGCDGREIRLNCFSMSRYCNYSYICAKGVSVEC